MLVPKPIQRTSETDTRSNRQALGDLLEYIRDDDTVRIASMNRFGRYTRDLYNIVAEITYKGAAVEFIMRPSP